MSKQKKAKQTPNASSGKPQDDEAERCPVLPNHAYLQDRAAVSDRCRVIRKYPYLQDRAAGPPDDRWTWEKLTDPDTGEVVEGWSPDDTVPAVGPTISFPNTPEEELAFTDDMVEILTELHETKVETYLRRQDERGQREDRRAAAAGEPKGITVANAAKMSGINRGTIWRAVQAGQIKNNGKSGTALRLDAEDFTRWCNERARRGDKPETDAEVEAKFRKVNRA